MKLLHVLTAACFAASPLAALSTTTALGPATPGVPLSFGGVAPAGTFTDIFTFSMPVSASSGYSVANFTPVPGYNTVFSTLTLYKNADGIVGNGDDTVLSFSAVGGSSMSLTSGANTAGSYYLRVTGTGTGTNGGIYTGAISVSAVPEPASYAIMLAGMAAIGFTVLRRRG